MNLQISRIPSRPLVVFLLMDASSLADWAVIDTRTYATSVAFLSIVDTSQLGWARSGTADAETSQKPGESTAHRILVGSSFSRKYRVLD